MLSAADEARAGSAAAALRARLGRVLDHVPPIFDAVDDERMVILDLYCEARPMWNQTEAFCGKPWVWCNIQNFGGRVVLYDINRAMMQAGRRRVCAARNDASRLK